MSKKQICKKGYKDSVKCPDEMYPCNYDDSCVDHNGNTLTHNLMIERKLYDIIKGVYKKKNITKLTINEIPPDMIGEILETFDLTELLHIRGMSQNFKNSVDEILKKKYTEIYKKSSPSKINTVILELKQALWPPFRKVHSEFYYGDFGMPNDLEVPSSETILNWADAVLTYDEKKYIVDFIVSEPIYGVYYDDIESIKQELKELLKVKGENNWYSNWLEHINKKNEIYRLLYDKIPDLIEDLEIVKYWLDEGLNFAELYHGYYLDNIDGLFEWLNIDRDDLYYRLINLKINEYPYYKVGDYFYYYNYGYPTRQYYGIAMVGYDIEKKQKVGIFDGEGNPNSILPDWLEKQFKRIGLNHNYPEDEITDFFRVYND